LSASTLAGIGRLCGRKNYRLQDIQLSKNLKLPAISFPLFERRVAASFSQIV
jgi:hypothetical protein